MRTIEFKQIVEHRDLYRVIKVSVMKGRAKYMYTMLHV